MSSTSTSVNGGSRNAVSRCSSAATPPIPKTTSGPNWRSRVTPMMSSTPGSAIGCTIAPPIEAPSAPCIVANASRTSSAVRSPRRTPPTSVLCTSAGEAALSATGYPMRSAAATAASAVPAASVWITGMPNAVRISVGRGVRGPRAVGLRGEGRRDDRARAVDVDALERGHDPRGTASPHAEAGRSAQRARRRFGERERRHGWSR